jgi:hypothetical protein
MSDKKNVIDYYSLNVVVEREPGEDLLNHLKTNILGTPGGIRYMHTQTEEKLRFIGDKYFLLLRKNGRMLGSVGLVYRETELGGKNHVSWYVRYFAIKAPLKSVKPKPGKLMEQSGRGMSLLRQTSAPYLSRPSEMLINAPEGSEHSLVYAFIETENFQSVQFANQNKFETVRKFTTFLYNRFYPSKSRNVFRIQENEKEEVKALLKDFYSDHSLYMEQNLFYRGDYLVYKENGKIVAGMQANPDGWVVKDMGGRMGRVFVRIMPFIPFIRRIFNPQNFRFVAGDYIFWKPGYEKVLNEIFETACNINRTGMLITWSDTGSKLLKTLDENVPQGLVGKVISRFVIEVKIKFNNYEPEEKKGFYETPTFISAFDAT